MNKMQTEKEKRAEKFLNSLGSGKTWHQLEEELQEAEEKENHSMCNGEAESNYLSSSPSESELNKYKEASKW